MIAPLLALWLALGPEPGRVADVPPALDEVAPALAVRWRALSLEPDGSGRAATLAPGKGVRVTLTASPLLRLHGAFSRGCGPLARRVFSAGGTELEVPLSWPGNEGREIVLLVPPALAPAPVGGGDLAPVTLRLSLPPGCASVEARAFEAEADPHPEGGSLVARELRALLAVPPPDDERLARWLAAPHPHRWQEEAALALALPRLLGDGPGVRALAAALLEQATAGPRNADPAFAMVSDLGSGSTRALAGEGKWRVLPAGGQLELEVAGEEVVRVNHRGMAGAPGVPLAWRLEAVFDDEAPVWLLGRAPIDPDAPEASRARNRELGVPPGARRLRLRAGDAPVLVWVVGSHAKAALLRRSGADVTAALLEASREESWAGRLAAAWLRRPPRGAEPRPDPLPAALLAVLQSRRSRDPDEAAGWLRRASEHLERVQTSPGRAAAALVQATVVRLRAQLSLAAGRPAEATAAWLALAARRPLCDEDAQGLLEADGFAEEALSGNPGALLAVDGLLARRPLDRELRLARQRAFTGGAQWAELSTDPGPREVHFLDQLPDDGAVAAPEHARFVALVPGQTREVQLPSSPLAGQLPLLALVTLRPPGAPALVRVTLDSNGYTVPALGPLDRVDLPGHPGRHLVRLSSNSGATQVLVNWSGGREPGRRWRRYLEVNAQELELHHRDMGSADLIAVAARVVAPAGSAPGPLRLVLSGQSLRPVTLSLRAGTLAAGASGDLEAELRASEVVEAIVPVASANSTFRISAQGAGPGVRVLVHVSVRRRAVAIPAEAPRAQPAPAHELPRETVAQLTARILDRPRAELYVQRAAALAEADELALAREDIIRALGDRRLAPDARRQALATWRHLDNVGSSSFPDTVDGRSAWAHSPAFGFVLAPMPTDLRALVRLVDDGATLRRLDAPALIAAGGGPGVGDFGLLAGARQAERAGDWARAARLWQALAAGHRQEAGLPARAAAALLALPPDPLRDVSAFVDLAVAVRLDPHDPIAARLFRRAAARTRLRPVHDVDDSAGIVSVEGGAGPDDSVEAALMATDAVRPGELVTRDRQLSLSLNLAGPTALRLQAYPRELRPAGARALGSPAIALEWSRDGEPVRQVRCPPEEDGVCRSESIELPAGAHTLVVRLQGGLRPAARVVVAPAACGRAVCRRVSVGRSAEYLLARAGQPVVVTLFGPGAVEAELRSTTRRRVSLSLLPAGGGRTVRQVAVPSSETGATVETMVLEREQAYRLEVRPERGEVQCRLLLRDGVGTDVMRPPAAPATLGVLGPPPVLAPPDLEHTLAVRVSDGDVAPGWDDLGALGVELGWQAGTELSDAVAVPSNSAALATVTYRRLIERLHLTLKVSGQARAWRSGRPSQAAGLHAYFMHPEARWARVFASASGATQPVGEGRSSSADGQVMLEPVARLMSGLHLVTKAGLRLRWQSQERVPRALLAEVDPEVWSGYAARHRRALFLEEGIEVSPLQDLVLYGGARVTSGEAFSWRRPDHLSWTTVARTAVERLTISASFRWSWFLPGAARQDALTSRAVSLALLHTLWLGHRHALLIGAEADHLIDLHAPQLVLHLGWEVSNGRRLRDHTAVEDENYFYPRRGPGREARSVKVEGP